MELFPPISASLGAMVCLAGKLDALQLDTELEDELNKLKIRLVKLSKARDPPATVSTWMNDVRELSYEMDNCVDAGEDWIEQMPGFKARVKEANGRYDRYIPESVPSPTANFPIADHQLLMVDGDLKHTDPVVGLYGTGGPVDRLSQRLSDREKKLMVVPILGARGIGKTTLVKQIWRQGKLGDFQCRAFARTAKKPDMRRILRSILAQVRPHQPPDANGVHELIQELNEHLKDKKYLLIIDDLWATSVWDVASRAFPVGNHGSRIITTTEIEDVALACCSYQSTCIFEMVPLSDSQSKELFTSSVFRSEEQYSPLLEEVTDEIIRRCAGLPQAIISISSVLASQGEANTVQYREQILNSLPTNTTSGEILKQVLKFCYNCLPSCLQTCLLYLSLYPENYLILKEDIIKQWVAEGFILAPKENEMKVAGSYFDKLVNMGLIQHIDVDYSDEILYYAVHHTVHDLITSNSIKQNFVTVMDYSQRTVRFSNNVSRLSLQFGSATHATSPASTTTGLSQVRSLAFFGLMRCQPSIFEFKLIRSLILHIWADQPRTGVDLRRISELLLLRYLQVTCNDSIHLPHLIQGLKHLETVEINATVAVIPSDIFHLLSLLHLRLGVGTELPDVTGILKNATLIPPISLNESSSPPNSVKTIDLSSPISRIPVWIGQFRKLSILKIVVRKLLREDMSNMQGLPSLTVLSLYVLRRTKEHIGFATESFSALECFEFRCGVLQLTFQEGAMPNLQRLKLGFNAGRGEQYGCFLVGFEHLSNVQEIVAIIGVAVGAEESDWEAAKTAFKVSIGKHPSKVGVKRTVMIDEEYGSREKQHSIIEKDASGEQPGSEKQDSPEDTKQSADGNSHSINRRGDICGRVTMVVVGEVDIGVTVLGFFLSPHISKLVEVARFCASTEYKSHTGTVKKLLKLAEDLDGIKSCFLGPANMGAFVKDPGWLTSLWQLEDAIHDAEEILDLFESHILELKAAKNLKKRGGSASSSKKSTDTSSSKSPSPRQLKKVLKNVGALHERVRELSKNPNVLSRIDDSSRSAGMGQYPLKDKKLFFGYGDEYEKLVSMLRDGNTVTKVIAIIGHGGMGKTELARQAFRDVASVFQLLVWVPAYGKKSEFDVLIAILESVAGDKPVNQMNIGSLRMELKELLSSKKCLLVLDDVWNDEGATSELERKQAWNGLRFLVGDGSKIVVTTRAKICSTTLCAEASIVLNGIKPNDIKLLLNDTAKLMSDGSQRRIQDLLSSQVLKFEGSPLAAVEIGKVLKKQTTEEAQCEILNNMDHYMISVLKGHLFTYHHLPPHLQRCFAFCSIFPCNWRFEPGKLTKMWMALGFVEESSHALGGMSSMEDIARGYFDSLVDRSLFQLEEARSMGEGDKHYVIHEQIHWMIRRASAQNCISISRHSAGACTSKASIPATVRHLSVTSGCLDQLEEYSTRCSNLRTLIVLKEEDDGSGPATLISAIDKDILKQFKGVRVLDLTETGITQLPEDIGELKHVRYLGLPSTISSNISDQVTRLLFLQTLSVGDKQKKRDIITNISGIGRLSKLQESIEFQVIRGSEKKGHSVAELAGMNSLGETLTIKGLDAVSSKEEAEEAQLGKKNSVKILKLEWGPPNPRQVDYRPGAGSSAAAAADPAAAVLEGLQPHRYLHELRITRYPGETSPASTWFSGLERLTRLYLKNCRKLKALPALGGLPSLELLDIKELTSIERINGDFCGGGVFPKLKKILLEDMRVLVAWDDMPIHAFPLLSDVSITNCPELSSLSGLGYCRAPLRLRVRECVLITPGTLPAKFSDGVSTCKFH